jgi:hypothetical protein
MQAKQAVIVGLQANATGPGPAQSPHREVSSAGVR